MPYADHQHGRDNRDRTTETHVGEPFGDRHIVVIAEPVRHGDVPGAPELGHRTLHHRTAEILRQFDAHDQRRADRHVRIAGQVAVIAIECADREQCPPERGVFAAACTFRQPLREPIGDHQFLEQAYHDQRHARGGERPVPAPLGLQLRHQPDRTLDRPGDQLGEEHHIDRELAEMLLRLALPAEDVDRVAQRLEGVERDPEREQEQHRGERAVAGREGNLEPLIGGLGEELEYPQEAEIGGDADPHQRAARPYALGSCEHPRDGIVDRGRE